MATDSWTEIRTAYFVARLGTVSAAASRLGVHHATVIRHVDALEARLGAKLFHRHARGYTPTEAGQDLLQVAGAVEEQFLHLDGRIKGQGQEVSGPLIVTSLPGLGDLIVPALTRFQAEYPELQIQYYADLRSFRLEYGEAHVALRAGPRPEEPDNVVQELFSFGFSMFASRDYIERHGRPTAPTDVRGHLYIGHVGEMARAPQSLWLAENVPTEAIPFSCSSMPETWAAVRSGAGIGFLRADSDRRDPSLVRLFPELVQTLWNSTIWIVTHVALHRTAKVQKAVNFLRAEARTWQSECTQRNGGDQRLASVRKR